MSITLHYATADVFTRQAFHGNPVAVVLNAGGLSPARMQAIAREFNYSETTFVLPPQDPAHTAHVRIFTPVRELPFAGHPNIGTAFLLARQALDRGESCPHTMVFEEGAGLVPMELRLADGKPIGAALTAPQPFARGATVTPEQAASCLSLDPADIATGAHLPVVVSVGLPFLAVELASRDALRRARPDKAAYGRILPRDGAHSVYAYTMAPDPTDEPCDWQARMFTSVPYEDPATGSATAAVSGLRAELAGVPFLDLRIRQGVDMDRPSTLLTQVRRGDGGLSVRLAGDCVVAMSGTLQVPAEP